jgi:hypothetical protein
MKPHCAFLLGLPFLPAFASAQHIRLGITAGSALTSDIRGINETVHNLHDPVSGRYSFRLLDQTTSRHPIIGPSLELDLPRNFSIEINALFRSLASTQSETFIYESGELQSRSLEIVRAKTWEFPLLLKYSLPLARFKPYIEAGPSFRVWQEPQALEPSKTGFTAGAGVDFTFGRVKAGPLLRYTRWAADGAYPRRSTKADQLEVLGSISFGAARGGRSIARRQVWLTLLGGLPLTNGLQTPAIPPFGPFLRESQSYLAGLGLEVELHRRFSIEANGIYRPIYARNLGYSLEGRHIRGAEFTVLTWPVPILAKLRLRRSNSSPFLEAGPSFRLSGNNNGYEPSNLGVTTGGGIEWTLGRFRLAPAVRYTRWKQDTSRLNRTNSDQLELLAGFSF